MTPEVVMTPRQFTLALTIWLVVVSAGIYGLWAFMDALIG